MSEIIAPIETAASREAVLLDTEKTIRTFARRAETPADRVAWAELEQEMLRVRQKWTEGGLLPDSTKTAAQQAAA